MATDTPQLLLLTSTRNHCRTHKCTHSNQRLLMSPCPDRRRETRNDSQRNCHCSDTRLELRMFAVKKLLSPTILSVLNPSWHCHSVSARDTTLDRSSLHTALLTSGTSAHSMNTHLLCAPRDRTTLALRTERSRNTCSATMLLSCCVFLGLIVVCCGVGEQPTAYPPKWARVYCGF